MQLKQTLAAHFLQDSVAPFPHTEQEWASANKDFRRGPALFGNAGAVEAIFNRT